MSWNPNQGQDPSQSGQYSQPGGYSQQDSYQQPGGYQQQYGPYGAPGGPAPSARPNPNGPTSMGLDANIAAGLSYLLSLVGGLIFYFGEKHNRFVRFSAMQSIIFSVGTIVLVFALFVLQVILTATIVLLPLAIALLCLAFLVIFAAVAVHIILAVLAFQGRTMRLPIIASYADKYANQTA